MRSQAVSTRDMRSLAIDGIGCLLGLWRIKRGATMLAKMPGVNRHKPEEEPTTWPT